MLEETGLAWFVRREDGWEAAGEQVLRAAGVPVERLDPGGAQRLFPALAVDDLAFVLYEPEGGVLRAADGVRALVGRAREAGARLVTGEARPDGVTVRLGSDRLEADAVVWACGAWLGRLLPGNRAPARHVPAAHPLRRAARVARAGLGGYFDAAFYGHGVIEPHGMKVAADHDGVEVDPDQRPLEATPDAVAEARQVSRRSLSTARLGAGVRHARLPHYGLTANGEFLFDRHPEHPGVWLLGGGSGHGYKHGPALAEHVAAVLAGRGEPEPRFALGERRPSRSLRTAGATLEAGKPQAAQPAGPGKATGRCVHLRRGQLLGGADRLVHGGLDHVLEHLDVLGVHGIGVEVVSSFSSPARR